MADERRYPRRVGELEVHNQEEEQLAQRFQSAVRSGDLQAARLAQMELSGRLTARATGGRLASSGYGMADFLGLSNWLVDTAGAVAGLSNSDAMPRNEAERRALRRGVRAGMQRENAAGYFGGQLAAGGAGGGAVANQIVRRAPALAATEGQRIANVARAGVVTALSEAPFAATRATTSDTPLRDAALETVVSGAVGSSLNAIGALALPAGRGVARWFGYDPEGISMTQRRSAPSQPGGSRVERLQQAADLGVELRAGSALSDADTAEIRRLAQRSTQARATLARGAEAETQNLQTGMQNAVRSGTRNVDMRERVPLPDQPAPAGDARTATRTTVDHTRQPLVTERGVRRTTAAELSDEASEFANEAMSALEAQNPTVIVPRELVNSLMGPGMGDNIGRVLDPTTGTSAYGQLADIVQATQGGPVVVPLRLLESIRSGVNNLSKIDQPGVTPEALRNIEGAIRTTIRAQVPAYGTYLDELAARGYAGRVGSVRAEAGAEPATGFQAGLRVGNEPPDVFRYAAQNEGAPGNIGRAEGTLAALADTAGKSPRAALELAEQLSTSSGNLRANVRTAFGDAAADPIEQTAQTISQAGRRQGELTGRLLSGGEQEMALQRQVGAAGAAAGGAKIGAQSLAAMLSGLVDLATVPPGMVNRLSRSLTTLDLNEAQRVLSQMDDMGINLQKWNAFATQALPGLVVGGRSAAASALNDEPPPEAATAPLPADADTEARFELEMRLRDAWTSGDDEAANDYLDALDRLENRGNPDNGRATDAPDLEAQIRDAYSIGNDDLARGLLSEYDRMYGGAQ